jgi:alpha-L-fucosidase
MTTYQLSFIRILLVVLIFINVNSAVSQNTYQPTKENLEARKWFQDAKYGMFIHWGVYSIMGGGEWIMETRKIPKNNYEKLPPFFNPIDFDAKEWVAIAKAAGMKYITITAKHHDGFAMYDSKVSDYNIVKRTPYGKDVLKMLAEECRKEGIKLFFYYSQLDWHHPDYFPRGQTGKSTGRPESGNWDNYIKFMNAQLSELLTNYGDIAGIWFDGYWDKKDADWKFIETYEMIHKLQPHALVGSNHHLAPFPGEDFQMFEKDLPGQNTSGFSGDAKIGALPLETCETISGSWGFNIHDNKYKTTKELVHYLVKAAGSNANFLLNVGPMPNGKIQQEFVDTLRNVGNWIQQYGETIYGTRQGPMPPKQWGVSTQKGNKIYIHILNWDDNTIFIPITSKVKQVQYFKTSANLKFQKTSMGIVVQLPESKEKEIDRVVEIIL